MAKSLIQALVATSICLVVGNFVYLLARKQKLSFRYAIGWMALCAIGIVGSLGTTYLNPIADGLGITTSALIGLSAMLLLVLLGIQLSISISGLQLQNRRLAEEIAILGREYNNFVATNQVQEHELDKTNVLVIMPAFNEELNLEAVIQQILKDGYQLLVIDDGSHDNTRAVVLKCGVPVLSLPYNLGVGGALKVGFRRACDLNFEAVVQVDADGQHQASEIKQLIDEANTTAAHMVIGSRFTSLTNELATGIPRRAVMHMLARSASKATGIHVTDPTSGFRLIRNPLLAEFSLNFPVNYLGDTYEALISAGRAGYKVREVPTSMKNRVHGVSTASNGQAIKFVLKSVLVAFVRLHVRIKTFSSDEVRNSQ